MSGDISHKGCSILVSGSITTGGAPVPILQTADDTDPLTFEDRTIAGSAVDTNGNMLRWSIASLIKVSFSITPSTEGFELMMRIADRQASTSSASEEIKLYRVLPNGSAVRLTKGIIEVAPPAESQSSGGRLSTGTFQMSFGDIKRTPALIELLN